MTEGTTAPVSSVQSVTATTPKKTKKINKRQINTRCIASKIFRYD